MTVQGSLEQRFADSMGALLGPEFPEEIALAVSGGGDSMAMLYLAHNWTRVYGLRLSVVTVDHGLRTEAAAEAAAVAGECAALGWPHATLRWTWDGRGNVQDAARTARLDLIDRWRGSIKSVLMAHTLDDLAETFLMRLARGSGVEGLSAMSARRRVAPGCGRVEAGTGDPPRPRREIARAEGMTVIRPCLGMRREELRHYLRTLGCRWVEDPTNDDASYDRVRMRGLLARLETEGLGVDALAATARRMGRAREALAARAVSVWHGVGREGYAGSSATGEILLDRTAFAAVESDTQMRLLAAALQHVSSARYRPRAEATEALLDRLLSGGAGTLHGCEARSEGDDIRIFREPEAVRALTAIVGDGTLWDRRWLVSHPDFIGLTVRALGEDGWKQAHCAQAHGVQVHGAQVHGAQAHGAQHAPPYRSARALPSIWDGARLVACDALGCGPGSTARLVARGLQADGFADFLLSH